MQGREEVREGGRKAAFIIDETAAIMSGSPEHRQSVGAMRRYKD